MSVAAQFSTISELFDGITKKYYNDTKPVLMYKTDKKYHFISYKDLRRNVELFTLGLSALGVKHNDKIAIVSENRPEWVIADMAIAVLGAISVPIYPTLTAKQIEFIFNNAEVTVAVASNQSQLNKIDKVKNGVSTLRTTITMNETDSLNSDCVINFSKVYSLGKGKEIHAKDFFPHAVKQVKADDLLTIIYTSGTTGNPKGVMLTHNNLVSNIKAAAEAIPFSSNDTFLSFLPLCHAFERMAGYYTAFSCGATIAFAVNA
jgi:long-chain acyl-CoA synthetase